MKVLKIVIGVRKVMRSILREKCHWWNPHIWKITQDKGSIYRQCLICGTYQEYTGSWLFLKVWVDIIHRFRS